MFNPKQVVDDLSWIEANQNYLNRSIEVVIECLLRVTDDHSATIPIPQLPLPMEHDAGKSALDLLTTRFGLSPFERAILVLCAGVELNAKLAGLCGTFHGDNHLPAVSFGMALAALPDPSWSALLPTAPLRQNLIIALQPSTTLTSSLIKIDERILHFLTGLDTSDERLRGRVRLCRAKEPLPVTRTEIARSLAVSLMSDKARCALHASSLVTAEEIIAGAADFLNSEALIIDGAALPTDHTELDRLVRLINREGRLQNTVFAVDVSCAPEAPLKFLLEESSLSLVVYSSKQIAIEGMIFSRFTVPVLECAEGVALFQSHLGDEAVISVNELVKLCDRFHPEPVHIKKACHDLYQTTGKNTRSSVVLGDSLRDSSRINMGTLARRITSRTCMDDLILPEMQKQLINQMIDQMHHSTTVYHDWGFAEKSGRGLGITALFAGTSGTGKTMAAEVIAHSLDLDLYHIDLSQVVSKYIGETEKNLGAVFDAAEKSGVILLFDEADALFGKRSEVKDSHDRYANIEVGYLLQRMESYSGLAILTTNHRESLDDAFLRRLKFIITFPFPDANEREQIWQRSFPPQAPCDMLDKKRLAQINATGGSIRNIALSAAFIAAAKNESIGYRHLRLAATAEYHKSERTLSEGETAHWPE